MAKSSSADKDIAAIRKAASTISGNFAASPNFVANVIGEIEQAVAEDLSSERAVISIGTTVGGGFASHMLAAGGLRLIEGDASGWPEVANGCVSEVLAVKTALDRTSILPAARVNYLAAAGFGVLRALFCAGSALLFPQFVERRRVLQWCQIIEDNGGVEHYTTDLFKSDVAQELQLQFVVMVRALRLESNADFETRINAAVGEFLGRPFDVRAHIQEAIASHAKAAAQGLKKKFSEYDVFPGFCIFPAHLIALARCLGLQAAPESVGRSVLTQAHLASTPTDSIQVHSALQKLVVVLSRSGLLTE